jgi:hypothetical protein
MNLIGIDPHVALTLAEYKQASVRASFPRKPARRFLAPVRRAARPGVTAVPSVGPAGRSIDPAIDPAVGPARVPEPRRTVDAVPAGRG